LLIARLRSISPDLEEKIEAMLDRSTAVMIVRQTSRVRLLVVFLSRYDRVLHKSSDGRTRRNRTRISISILLKSSSSRPSSGLGSGSPYRHSGLTTVGSPEAARRLARNTICAMSSVKLITDLDFSEDSFEGISNDNEMRNGFGFFRECRSRWNTVVRVE
jgi:hypothetical protein